MLKAPIVHGFAINPPGGPDIFVEGTNRFVREDEFLAYKAWADTALATAVARARREALEEAVAKAEGQLAYWREQMRAEKCLEDGISEDGETYTPIGDVAAWEGGYCNGRMGEAEWWIGTLRALIAKQPLIDTPSRRQAIARLLDRDAASYGSPDYFGPDTDRATYSARHRVALKTADAILALLAATPPEARQTETGWKPPAGWKLVPEKPTEEMVSAAWMKTGDRARYSAMLAASPPPPAIGNLEGEGRS